MRLKSKDFFGLSVGVLLIVAMIIFIGTHQAQAILHIPNTNYSIQNEKSQLLELLVLPDDLKSNVSLFYIRIYQGKTNLQDNEIGVVESASSTLGGFYRSREITILTKINRFNSDDPIKITNISNFNSDSSLSSANDLSDLKLLMVSDNQKYRCSYSISNETICYVRLISSDKLITLEIQVNTILNKPSTEEVLNLILEIVKKKVNETNFGKTNILNHGAFPAN